MFKDSLIVGCGGAVGALFRFMVSGIIPTAFPLATLLINIIGSFLLGYFTALLTRRKGSKRLMLLVGTGYCGGFTTFSTFSKESFELAQHSVLLSLTYIVLSVAFGLSAAWLGMWAGNKGKKEVR
ncbi:MAG: fluoride efflux transporter CrcB [Bacillus sp. (in: firmicutes)]